MRSSLAGFSGSWAELLCRRRHRVMLAVLLVSSLLTMQVYRQQVVRGLPVAVVDMDGSALSRTVRAYLASSPELQLDNRPLQSVQQAAQRLERGELAAVVLLPAGMSEEVKRGRPGELLVALQMSNILVGRNAYKGISRVLTTVDVGIQIKLLRKLGQTDEQALAVALPITVEDQLPFNPAMSYAVYVVPGLLAFLLYVWVLIRTHGALQQAGSRPAPLRQTAGALLAVATQGILLGAGLLHGLLPLGSMPPHSPPSVTLPLLALFIVVTVGMAAALVMLIPFPVTSLQLTLVAGMLSMPLSGITWPSDMFPVPLARAAAWLPLTPFVNALQMFQHHELTGAELTGPVAQLGRQGGVYVTVVLLGLGLRWLLCRPGRTKPAEGEQGAVESPPAQHVAEVGS